MQGSKGEESKGWDRGEREFLYRCLVLVVTLVALALFTGARCPSLLHRHLSLQSRRL